MSRIHARLLLARPSGMRRTLTLAFAASALVAAPHASLAHQPDFTDSFMADRCQFSTTGTNAYFVLRPGYRLTLEGDERKGRVRLTVTVLADTLNVDGVATRVVEERETLKGETVEVSRNYFAICTQTNSVFYFGEDVDVYEDGKIANHEGGWRAGENGARAGVIMPGLNLIGARYFQEIAPGVAMDRAETISLSDTLTTPYGRFDHVLKVEESTPLEPGAREFKRYAAGIGLVQDGKLLLISVSP